MKKVLIVIILIELAFSFLNIYRHNHKPVVAQKKIAPTITNSCVTNLSGKNVIVSINDRHLWACNGKEVAYNSSVITGYSKDPADITPIGTYPILKKLTNQTLAGCDDRGCWNDYVNYDMIWLYNQYGHYDFHDATWRAPADFGNISPDTTNASRGCVEMPLAAAKWLYGWAPVGTPVNIVN